MGKGGGRPRMRQRDDGRFDVRTGDDRRCDGGVSVDGHLHHTVRVTAGPMLRDEFVRGEIIAEITQETAAKHADLDVFANLQMEMSFVHPEIVADSPDLLATMDLLTLVDGKIQEVAVEGVAILQFKAFVVGVPEDHDISPADVVIAGKGDESVGDGVDRIAKITVATAETIPVLAQVAIGAIPTSDVVAGAGAAGADWQLESIGRTNHGGVLGVQG